MYPNPNTIPLVGRWFADAKGHPVSLISFDIKNSKTYPFSLDGAPRAPYVRIKVPSTARGDVRDSNEFCHFDGRITYAEDNESSLLQLLQYVRTTGAAKLGLGNLIPLKRMYDPPYETDDPTPERFFAMNLAKQVIFCERSPEEIAREFNVSETNVRIWVSTYFLYGQKGFRIWRSLKPEILRNLPYEKFRMANDHLENMRPIYYTAASYCIPNLRRFRRLLRFHRNYRTDFPLFPPSTL